MQRRDEDLLVVQHGTSFDYLRELQLVVALLRRVYKEIAIFLFDKVENWDINLMLQSKINNELQFSNPLKRNCD